MAPRRAGQPRCSAPRLCSWAACLGAVGVLASAAPAFDPLNGDYTREDSRDVPVVSYNHAGYFIASPSRDATFNRILVALDPDIICFQEFTISVSAGEIQSRLSSILPVSGGTWHVHTGLPGGIRTAIASRFPLSLTRTDTVPGSSIRGVTIALADLPDPHYATDVYLVGAHLRCCGEPGGSEDASRQRSADAIANWLGDARGAVRPSGDHVTLPPDTPIINLGDFNLVGGPQPEDTLITGDIQNEATFGPDVRGDWDVSDMTDLVPRDPFTSDDITWQGDSECPPTRLDRFFYTDSMLVVANSFVLNSNTRTPAALAATGLQVDDTLPRRASDHLPIALDLRLPVPLGDGDSEPDGDVDLADVAGFQYCFGTALPECRPANLTGTDGRVDLADYAALAERITGP